MSLGTTLPLVCARRFNSGVVRALNIYTDRWGVRVGSAASIKLLITAPLATAPVSASV